MARTYWPGLVRITVKLCRYYSKHKAMLPSDIPNSVKLALDALVVACDALIIYDKAKTGGPYSA